MSALAAVVAGTAARAFASALPAVDGFEIRGGAEAVARKRVDAGDPYLRGHFPGRPIYPGVFVVETVFQAARRFLRGIDGAGVELLAVESARFQAPLFADDVLTARLAVRPADAPGVYTVDGRCTGRDGTAVARVLLRCGALPHGAAGDRPPGPVVGPPPGIDPAGLLPHRPPMLLVERVLAAGPTHAVTEWTVRPDEPCFRHPPTGVDPVRCAYPVSLMLESFGQGGAVLFMGGRPAGGTLVLGAVRQARVHAPVLPGETMRHHVRVEYGGAHTSIVSGTTWVGERLCLSVGSLVAAVRDTLRGEGRPAAAG